MLDLRSPEALLAEFVHRVEPVALEREPIELMDAVGRILADPVSADRDHPPCDLALADGWAVRVEELSGGGLPIFGGVRLGTPAPPLPAWAALRVSAGSCVPGGANAIVTRDQATERQGRMELVVSPSAVVRGTHVRFRGEDALAGQVVLQAGELVTPAACLALGSYGVLRPLVRRRLRITVVVIGDELEMAETSPGVFRVRDANGPALGALLRRLPWIEVSWRGLVADVRSTVLGALSGAFRASDAVLFTGGGRVGVPSHLAEALQALGAEMAFRELPVRPGRRVIAALGADGQPVLGLPGTPESALMLAHYLALPVLRKRAGFARPGAGLAGVSVLGLPPDGESQTTLRLVRLIAPGRAELLATRGPSDWGALARADGFVVIPPGPVGSAPVAFQPWIT
jgi:molybdopterin molybdotransferase